MLGIKDNLVEFNYEKMKITKSVGTKNSVYHMEKVNDDAFLTGEGCRHIELINKKDLRSLSQLKFEEVFEIH